MFCTFQLLEQCLQRLRQIDLANINYNIDDVTSVDEPLVDFTVDCFAGLGRFVENAFHKTGTIYDGDLKQKANTIEMNVPVL